MTKLALSHAKIAASAATTATPDEKGAGKNFSELFRVTH
jgi:hypothetical protein